jgi:hypothetical protein
VETSNALQRALAGQNDFAKTLAQVGLGVDARIGKIADPFAGQFKDLIGEHSAFATAMANTTALDELIRKIADPFAGQFKDLIGEHSAFATAMANRLFRLE